MSVLKKELKKKKEYKYFSKKMGKIVNVRKHEQHYWLKKNNRWSRIDPVKYHLVELETAKELKWLTESDIRMSDYEYNIPKGLDAADWVTTVQENVGKINKKYANKGKDHAEDKLYELCELSLISRSVAPSTTTFSHPYLSRDWIRAPFKEEVPKTIKDIPPHPKWGYIPRMFYPLAETVEIDKNKSYGDWFENNRELMDDIATEMSNSPFSDPQGSYYTYFEGLVYNGRIRPKLFWRRIKVELMPPEERKRYNQTDIISHDKISQETKKALRKIGFENISIRKPGGKYLITSLRNNGFSESERKILTKITPAFFSKHTTRECDELTHYQMRYVLHQAKEIGRGVVTKKKKRPNKKERIEKILKDDKTFHDMSRAKKSRHLQKLIGSYVKGVSVSTDYVVLIDPDTHGMSKSMQPILELKPRGATKFNFDSKQRKQLAELGITRPEISVRLRGDTWENAKKKLIKHLESQI